MVGSRTTSAPVKVAVLAAVVGISSAANAPLITDQTTFASQLVQYHNQVRAYNHAPAMTWSASLAAGAQTWAEGCSFTHSVSNGAYGENLFTADPVGTQSGATAGAVEAWYNEVVNPGYDFEQPTYQPGAGHFSQVVWKASTTVGCGAANCNGHSGVLPAYVVCRYGPAGNFDTPTEFKDNVLPCTSDTAPHGGCTEVSLPGADMGRKLMSSMPYTAVKTTPNESA